MFDTLLIRPLLHCNTPLHFTTLHPATLHYTTDCEIFLAFSTFVWRYVTNMGWWGRQLGL